MSRPSSSAPLTSLSPSRPPSDPPSRQGTRPPVPPGSDPPASGARARPDAAVVVLLSRDQPLIDHVAALADAVGAPLAVQASPVRPDGAGLTLSGPDIAAELPRGRGGGIVVLRVEGADPPDTIWRHALEIGADRVAVLPEAEPWLLEALADAADPPTLAPVVAVMPGSGGAGASTLAVSLAVVASRAGVRTVLVDADPLGGGLDLAVGLDAMPGLRWPHVPPGRWSPGLAGTALPRIGPLHVLTGDRDEPVPLTAARVVQAVDAVSREADLVVVDLPRAPDGVSAELLPRCRCVLLVAPAEVRAAAAAGSLAAALAPLSGDLRLVVRTRGPGGPSATDIADALELPLAGQVAASARLATAMERGEAAALADRGALAELCREVLADALEHR